MNQPSIRNIKRFVVVAAVALTAVSIGVPVSAYTVITRDGHLIQAVARPEIRGLQAYMRLAPHGQLAVIQEELIDWSRTDASNPAPQTIAIPADAKMAGKGAPIEIKIKGNPAAKDTTAPEQTKQAQGEKGKPATLSPEAQESLVKLQKEFALVAGARDGAAERKKALEAELAGLESKETGYASEDSAAARRLNELRQQIGQAGEEIARFEMRLADIRAEAIQLGGTID